MLFQPPILTNSYTDVPFKEKIIFQLLNLSQVLSPVTFFRITTYAVPVDYHARFSSDDVLESLCFVYAVRKKLLDIGLKFFDIVSDCGVVIPRSSFASDTFSIHPSLLIPAARIGSCFLSSLRVFVRLRRVEIMLSSRLSA
jgi:hypothetical protein